MTPGTRSELDSITAFAAQRKPADVSSDCKY